jgi:hypothetical protein
MEMGEGVLHSLLQDALRYEQKEALVSRYERDGEVRKSVLYVGGMMTELLTIIRAKSVSAIQNTTPIIRISSFFSSLLLRNLSIIPGNDSSPRRILL